MSKLTMVEPRTVEFQIGKWAQSWLEDGNRLGAFGRDRFEFMGRLHHFVTGILERKIVEDSYPVYFEYKVPSSWWQMFKRDKAPKWFKSRYPVQTVSRRVKRTVNITRKATYPMADIVVPKNMNQVVIKDVVSPFNFYEEEL